jgi:signal transduction histidine kinase/CheY-like chemotaxis protein
VALAIRELRRQRAEIRSRILESAVHVAARERAEGLASSAETADKAKSAFLAMMSHEIRTPLNAIIGYAQLLKSSPEQHSEERLGIICKSGEILQRILDDILDFSKIEAGKLSIKRQSVSIRGAIADVAGAFEEQARSKGIEIFTEISSEVPEFLMIDPVRFNQILSNLVSNAVKFTETGSVRVVTSAAIGDPIADPMNFLLRVRVLDEGPGIEIAEESLLFQPFSQVDSRTARRHEGTGLGLVICRRLCELMGGQVKFQRRSEKGSEFFFELPAPRSEAPSVMPPEPRLARRLEEHMAVLVVDDNPVNARLLGAVLKRFGVEPRIASSGSEALMLLRQNDFDVIFMDIQMPEMDGLETTARVRDVERSLGRKPCFVIAVTADILMSDPSSSLAAGMDGHLSKPINIRQVEEVMARLAASRGPETK